MNHRLPHHTATIPISSCGNRAAVEQRQPARRSVSNRSCCSGNNDIANVPKLKCLRLCIWGFLTQSSLASATSKGSRARPDVGPLRIGGVADDVGDDPVAVLTRAAPSVNHDVTGPGGAVMSRYHETVRQTTVRLPEDLAQQAEAVARVRQISLNQLLIEALQGEIARLSESDEFIDRAVRVMEQDRAVLQRLTAGRIRTGVTRTWTAEEFFGDYSAPTDDEVPIAADGRPLDTPTKVRAYLEEIDRSRAATHDRAG